MIEADIESAYRRYFPIVRAKCQRMLGDATAAQDIAQETFLRLWAHRENLQDHNAVAAWIYKTSTRLAVDVFRQRTSSPTDDAQVRNEVVDLSNNPESLADSRFLLARIAREIPKKELQVAIMSRLDGLSHQEIADVMAMSDRSVRRILVSFESHLAKLAKLAQRERSVV